MDIQGFCKQLEEGLLKARCCQEKVDLTEHLLNQLSCSDIDCCEKWDCCSGRYARHLVNNGERSGCCIVAMSCGPGQATPVHDHDGTWCVECCLEGQLEVVQYELEEAQEIDDGPLYLLEPKETQFVGRGAVGCLIPPFEHHTIHNPFSKRAVTLHVYGKELKKSACFYPVAEGLYRREERPLSYANADL